MTREQALQQIRGKQQPSAYKANPEPHNQAKATRTESLEKARAAAAKARKSKKDKK